MRSSTQYASVTSRTYTWRWDLGYLIITGADILHFHDDLIWRQFIDYQAGE